MVDHIAFFKNQITQYGVLHDFREALMYALQEAGVRVSLIDVESLKQSVYRNPPDFTFAFNGLPPMSNGKFLCDELEIPHIGWLVDSAYYFYSFSKTPLNFLVAPDARSAEILTNWGAKNVWFLPHAFNKKYTKPPDLLKQYPLVFLGSLIDPDETEELWKSHLPPKIRSEMVDAGYLALESELTYQSAYEKVIGNNLDFFAPLSVQQMADIGTTLDCYIRAKDRINLLRSVKDLPLHIFGNCLSKRTWQDVLGEGNYKVYPSVNFPEAIEVMQQSQIILNSSPMFKTGAHERIFYGFGCGSFVFTNDTPWLRSNFTDEELGVYSSKNPLEAKGKLEALFANRENLLELTLKGQQKVLKDHTWDNRAADLLKKLH